MKKYYLFLIILFALKCSIIAQKVEPSRTYNVIEECYCTSFKQVGKLYNGTIVYVCTKCGKETTANPNGVGGTIEDIIEQNKREAKLAEMLKNPSASGNNETLNNMLGDYQSSAIDELSNEHYCVSFKFIDENPTGFKNYECSECGHKVTATEERTISDIIADNKERMRIGNTALDLLKKSQQKTQPLQKNQKLSNQQKPTTTSKPQSKTTSKPSTTTKKQQTNLDIPSVNRSSSKVAVEQPKPTVEENLGKISDGIDAAIDMVKKISNKDGTNNTTLKENYNPNQERGLKEALRYNKPGSPNYDPKKKWLGSLQDVLVVGANERENFKIATNTHEGQNIGMAVPYTPDDMMREIRNGNQRDFCLVLGDQFHQPDNINSVSKFEERKSKTNGVTALGAILGCVGGGLAGSVFGPVGGLAGCIVGGADVGAEAYSASTRITDSQQISQYLEKYIEKGIKYAKFQNSTGEEVVYNLETRTIDLEQTLGTYNKYPNPEGALFHGAVDVTGYNINQEWRGKNVKYAGITYSYNDDGSVSIIDAQTGKPMTGAEVERFATSRADTTPAGTVNLPPEVFSVEQSTTPYSNYGQQRQNNNSALSTPKKVFGK